MKATALICSLLLALVSSAQQGKHIDHLAIVSSTVCDMCKQTIEGNLIYEKGVKKVEVDLATSTVHVDYDAKKNTPEGLRAALIKLGYAADGTPGDARAFSDLPACCQKEGCGKLPEEKH
ncbi:MAG TPA: heavy metal-associated domain-containing protein [Flavobacteriales bacterium]|nr:heavy metal-associated domain-containing protein [Flavobacteriales bacterium]